VATRTLLLIDDSETYRRKLKLALEAAGFSTLEAVDGEAGFKLAREHRPHAVLVDSSLPSMDGAMIVRRLRLDPELRKTPCLLLAEHGDASAEVRALDAGADAFAFKNQELDLIVARVTAMMRASAPEAGQLANKPKHLLVVDDDSLYLDMITDILRDDGYETHRAGSGEAALEVLSTINADCILLDLMMPGIGGIETCRRIKHSPGIRDIPLVLVTSLGDRDLTLEGFAAGADDFVLKTDDPSLLRARVRAQVRRKQFEDENRRMRHEVAQQQLADTRADLLEDLQRKNKELEAFGYSVSHDLRAPLRAIDGFGRALEEDWGAKLDDHARDLLRRMLAASKRMGELIDDLLRLSRVGRTDLRREPVDLAALAKVVTSALEKSAPERRVEIVMPANLTADGDPRLLRLLLENLLGNAWKFTVRNPAARVELGCRVEGGETIYFVRDNGVGFDMGFAGKLFTPFHRLHAEVDFPGTGVGLATVYRIIDRHGGRIWAESAPNKGTTFSFTLPLSRAG
jgi:DNA-binding response OmpR family regulator